VWEGCKKIGVLVERSVVTMHCISIQHQSLLAEILLALPFCQTGAALLMSKGHLRNRCTFAPQKSVHFACVVSETNGRAFRFHTKIPAAACP
jgi:hypothetical protein